MLSVLIYGNLSFIASTSGLPIEVIITPASTADITAFKTMKIDIAPGSTIYADKTYTDYGFEDLLEESASLRLVSQRKTNMVRQHHGPLGYLQPEFWVYVVGY